MKKLIKSFIICVILSLSWVWGQCNEGHTEIDGDCYYQSDLDVLQIFIDNSDSTINMDMDIDSSGVIEPLELGDQKWVDGRITEFWCYWDDNGWNRCEISGEIPPEIGELTNLTYLVLGLNQLTGSIPSEIGELTNLTFLGLGVNKLTGSIPPEISNLTNLTHLYLGSNQLTGEIPEGICDLTLNFSDDYDFNLSNNQLCSSYPPCVEDYIGEQDTTNCSPCDEGYTKIDGDCYYQSELDVLQIFIDNSSETINWDLDTDSSGVIEPLELGDQKWVDGRMTEFWCYWNDNGWNRCEISGEIPPDIGNLTNLTYLILGYNQLTGSIPPELGNLISLTVLWLDHNQLTGSIPSEIGNLTNLSSLYLSSNQLEGEIPESICELNLDWDSSHKLKITNNQLCPSYPSCIEAYVGEQDDTNCSFCGKGYTDIDGECYYRSDLDVLKIFIDNSSKTIDWYLDTDSSGVIEPLELGYQRWEEGRLTYLQCEDNDLSDVIPPEISNLTNLTFLGLGWNQFTGTIPPEIGYLINLTHLDLLGNELTGTIPPEIGNLTNLTHLYLWSNRLTGTIPPEIGSLTNLTHLDLLSNQLVGTIHPEIGNLKNLIYLTLGYNELTGDIPESICQLVDNGCWVHLTDNQLCPPYPSCVEDYVGEQDTPNCD